MTHDIWHMFGSLHTHHALLPFPRAAASKEYVEPLDLFEVHPQEAERRPFGSSMAPKSRTCFPSLDAQLVVGHGQ